MYLCAFFIIYQTLPDAAVKCNKSKICYSFMKCQYDTSTLNWFFFFFLIIQGMVAWQKIVPTIPQYSCSYSPFQLLFGVNIELLFGVHMELLFCFHFCLLMVTFMAGEFETYTVEIIHACISTLFNARFVSFQVYQHIVHKNTNYNR